MIEKFVKDRYYRCIGEDKSDTDMPEILRSGSWIKCTETSKNPFCTIAGFNNEPAHKYIFSTKHLKLIEEKRGFIAGNWYRIRNSNKLSRYFHGFSLPEPAKKLFDGNWHRCVRSEHDVAVFEDIPVAQRCFIWYEENMEDFYQETKESDFGGYVPMSCGGKDVDYSSGDGRDISLYIKEWLTKSEGPTFIPVPWPEEFNKFLNNPTPLSALKKPRKIKLVVKED